ncbi:hypothetical protein [Erythrobacter aureus]|uniref:Uncharacterized protein n=1 Tax=Erythrobacter aureus TaxID=2182384 RepID=A0A345YIX6_9SPHN|nr:hypothetical protein [Erythrobacter aureus]AXK43878.1 hypothetical protein DVR09_15600 [Erythrobacter aureus]
MTPNERALIRALRPFASIAAHLPADALKNEGFVEIDKDHPDIGLSARDFANAYKTVLAIDPAFRREQARQPDLIDRTFGHPRWGYLAYTLLGLTGGFLSAKLPDWAARLSEALATLL